MRRTPSLPLLLSCLLLLVVGGLDSVHDLLQRPSAGNCQYCRLGAEPPRWLPPPGLSLPALLLDLTPETLAPLLLPRLLLPVNHRSAAAGRVSAAVTENPVLRQADV